MGIEHSKHIFRVFILLAVVIAGALVGRILVVPETHGLYGHFRGASVLENAKQEVRHGSSPRGAEPEHPDCLLAVHPQYQECDTRQLPAHVASTFIDLAWQGTPNQLSPDHVDWVIIDETAIATVKPRTDAVYNMQETEEGHQLSEAAPLLPVSSASLRQIIRQRRSAVAMDARTKISQDTFFHILSLTLARPSQIPFNTLSWASRIHLALFVHRVQGMDPGLYILLRDTAAGQALAPAMKDEFAWEKPQGCPAVTGLAAEARSATTLAELAVLTNLVEEGCRSNQVSCSRSTRTAIGN